MNYIKGKMQQSKNLESELGTAPVTTLSVVSENRKTEQISNRRKIKTDS
jgi:hypothetical protein